MKTLYHGTSYEAAKNIQANGFFSDDGFDTIWNCSCPDYLYVRDADHFDEDEVITYSIESGQIAAAAHDSKSNQIAIFKIEVSDEVFEDYFSEDDSCENMDGCFQVDKEELDALIRYGQATVTVDYYGDSYISYLRVFYIASLVMHSQYYEVDDQILKDACKIVNDSGAFLDDLFCYGDIVESGSVELELEL